MGHGAEQQMNRCVVFGKDVEGPQPDGCVAWRDIGEQACGAAGGQAAPGLPGGGRWRGSDGLGRRRAGLGAVRCSGRLPLVCRRGRRFKKSGGRAARQSGGLRVVGCFRRKTSSRVTIAAHPRML